MNSWKSRDLLVIVHSGYDHAEHSEIMEKTVWLVGQLIQPDVLFVDEPIYEGVFLRARNRYLLAEALNRVFGLLSMVQFYPVDDSLDWQESRDDALYTQKLIRFFQTDYIEQQLSHFPEDVINSCFEFLPVDFVRQCIFRKRRFWENFSHLESTIDSAEELSVSILQKLWKRFDNTGVFSYTRAGERKARSRRIAIEEGIKKSHPQTKIFTAELEAGKIETDGIGLVPGVLSKTYAQFNQLWWPSFLSSFDYRILSRDGQIIVCWEYEWKCVQNCVKILSNYLEKDIHIERACCVQ